MQRKLDGSNGDNGLNRSSFSSAQATNSAEHVAILLSTYNGASFLARQLDSLLAQSHQDWTIYASDDGSSDSTLDILENYRQRLGSERLVILPGPQQGFAKNFMSLLRRDSIRAPYFAFCDQDDLWHPERLEVGLRQLRALPPNIPALSCSRTQLIDEHDRPIGLSPLFKKPPCFENALVQSIAGGNTMLFNQATRLLLSQTPPDTHIVSHDWWTYILVTGCGGHVFYTSTPTISYRQHGKNIVGANSSPRDRLIRVGKMFKGTFRAWTDDNLRALSFFKSQLSPPNQATLGLFEQGRQASLIRRLKLIHRSAVHRQTLPGTIGLIAAAVLHRI